MSWKLPFYPKIVDVNPSYHNLALNAVPSSMGEIIEVVLICGSYVNVWAMDTAWVLLTKE
jgi:hypothetical protein